MSSSADGNLAATYSLIFSFLNEHGHQKAAQAVKKAAKETIVLKDDFKADGTALDELVKEWKDLKAKAEVEAANESSSSESSSSESDSEEAPNAATNLAAAAGKIVAPNAKARKASAPAPSSSSSSSSPSSSSSESDSDSSPVTTKKVASSPKTTKVKKAPSAPRSSKTLSSAERPESSSSSDSSEDEAPQPAPAAKKSVKAKVAVVSKEKEQKAAPATSTNGKTKKSKKPASSSSSSSSSSDSDDSDASSKPKSKPVKSAVVPAPKSAPAPAAADESQVVTKKRRTGMDGSATTTAVASTAREDVVEEDTKPQNGSAPVGDASANGKKEKKGPRKSVGTPFQRVKAEQVEFSHHRLADNTYEAKGGVDNDYGARAHRDLIVTRGAGFRKEKNKKKKGSYRGGEITMESHSIKFTS